MMRDELGDDSEGGKPWLCGLVKSRLSINYSNIFAKDWHTSATQVFLTASARFQIEFGASAQGRKKKETAAAPPGTTATNEHHQEPPQQPP